ncbi:aminotransferase class V-fold PLP-dependent enzyme [Sphingomonas sp. LHG3406-1]|uniref:cysteine desulfurase family protein n=1 Tax=Sphingomonas sp. LHG3406-1 TaxID=2804617 RepID=UPI00261B87E6|nr:aminotransferase class V-fold PLP-dependent enzyme [Sphingomonas sp. LHG3406-1]
MSRSRTYLDHAATTPVLPEAQAAMAEALGTWANPSSPHADGRAAKAALERARAAIADALGWRHDVIFTSGASEAIGMAAARAAPPRRIIGATEHDVVPHAMGEGAEPVPVDGSGRIDLDALGRLLGGPPALVAIQHVNNETGVIQPIDAIFRQVKAAGGLLLADCAQSAGKIDLPNADFIAISAHKFGGPPGIGALLVRDLATLAPSGGQEKGYRRGTQNLPAIAGMAAALATGAHRTAMPRLAALRDRLEKGVRAAGGLVIGDSTDRIPAISAIALEGASKDSLLVQLDLAGFAVSAGSACSSGKMKASRVLAAMGVPEPVAAGALRVSFGPQTVEADIDAFLAAFTAVAARRRAA